MYFLQINVKMSGHMASEGDINAMVKEVSCAWYWISPSKDFQWLYRKKIYISYNV